MGSKIGTLFLIIGSMIGTLFIGSAVAYFSSKTGDEFNSRVDSQLAGRGTVLEDTSLNYTKSGVVYGNDKVNSYDKTGAVLSVSYPSFRFRVGENDSYYPYSLKHRYSAYVTKDGKIDEEESKKIKVDLSKVDYNKKGVYQVYFSYYNEESGVLHKVTALADVGDGQMTGEYYGSFTHKLNIYRDKDTGVVNVRNLSEAGERIAEINNPLPTRQDFIEGGANHSVQHQGGYVDTVFMTYSPSYWKGNSYVQNMMLNTKDFDVEFKYDVMDLNVPGVYHVPIIFMEKSTGKEYKTYIIIQLYKEPYRQITSGFHSYSDRL